MTVPLQFESCNMQLSDYNFASVPCEKQRRRNIDNWGGGGGGRYSYICVLPN